MRDSLVNNESLSKSDLETNSTDSVSVQSLPNVLTGRYPELILKSILKGFESTSVLVTNPDGIILAANTIAANGFPNSTTESVIGKNFCDLAPPQWAQERVEFMNLAIQRKSQLMVIEILDGTRLCSTISPIQTKDGDDPEWILIFTVEQITPVTLEWLRKTKNSEELIDAKFIDLGRLAVLSPRELEVLALMGQGLRQKQIAERLHRSVSTIDRHRERIGEKLGITDRVELVGLAREAALEVIDASRTNTSFGHQYPAPEDK